MNKFILLDFMLLFGKKNHFYLGDKNVLVIIADKTPKFDTYYTYLRYLHISFIGGKLEFTQNYYNAIEYLCKTRNIKNIIIYYVKAKYVKDSDMSVYLYENSKFSNRNVIDDLLRHSKGTFGTSEDITYTEKIEELYNELKGRSIKMPNILLSVGGIASIKSFLDLLSYTVNNY